MGGCTNCKGKAGCDDHKSTMMGEVEQTLEALYPTQTWGEPDDSVAVGLPLEDIEALADELSAELRAATFVRPGGDDEPCDYIYILCLGRAPCVVQVRDHGVAVPEEWLGEAAPPIHELYLRVVISQRAKLAAVQQVAIELVPSPGGFMVHERPRAGVYDPPLLARMQKLVAILPAYELTHVDFGEIAHASPSFAPGAWEALYGAKPAIANYFFYPQPTTMVATTFVPAVGGAA